MSIVRPAGWYPDGANFGQQRWWDGNQWTANVQAAYQAGGGILAAPAGTSPHTLQIWLIVGTFALLSFWSVLWPLTIDWNGYVLASLGDPSGITSSAYLINAQYFALLGFGLLAWAGSAVLAYFDGRALEARGVVRPFHWALTAIPSYGPLIYIIGRSVVVRRRTGSGLAPMWVMIISLVASIVLFVAVLVVLVNSMMGIASYGGY